MNLIKICVGAFYLLPLAILTLPMKRVVISDNRPRRLAFYLAVEEWVARTLPADSYFFTWIVEPTVICGRNQDVAKEVDLDYCRRHGIDVVRRRSGGGCVFADRNNIMISQITPDTDVATAFAAFTGRVAGRLRAMGLNAQATGRNDIEIDGRKISGNAFYRLPGRSIAHGTMLYDTDPEHMAHAITPSRAKLESKKVQSVAKHIVTAHELLPGLTIDAFHRALTEGLGDGEVVLTPVQIAEIEAIEQRYYRPGWLIDSRDSRRRTSVHIDGVGEITAVVNAPDGRIADVALLGDFFALDDLDAALFNRLRGVPLEPEAIAAAIAGVNVADVVRGLDNRMFINLLTQ